MAAVLRLTVLAVAAAGAAAKKPHVLFIGAPVRLRDPRAGHVAWLCVAGHVTGGRAA